MDIFHISSTQAVLLQDISAVSSPGFLWLDATHDEVTADVNAWRDTVERATGVHIYDLHLSDAVNLSHPSYFDATQDYALMVFRKLALAADKSDADQAKRRIPPALSKLDTKPVTFLLMDNALVTVHAENSRTIDAMRSRLLEARNKREGATYANRPPASAEELMLRLLNAMVDQYLALRQPLTAQIDRWQRALLNPRSLFNDWTALLDARIYLRKLDQLSEGQHDAVQELRDYLIDSHSGG
ncbi:MAG: CorA family divalent cation transporter, partial [Bacillota bacterium]